MISNALWKKEWKHASILIYAIFVVFLIQFPIGMGLKIEEWKEIKHEPYFFQNVEHEVYSSFSNGVFIILLVVLIIGLAAVLIGKERNSKRHDFSLALPFSRTSMFLTKMALGLGSILFSFILNYWIGYLMLSFSEFSYLLSYLNIFETFVIPFIGYIVLFTFAMFIGTFSGNIRSQYTLSLIFLTLPPGMNIMFHEFVNIHQLGYYHFSEHSLRLFWPIYLFGRNVESADLLIPIIFTIIFFVVGLLLFNKAPAEHSGEFIVFDFLKPIFLAGILICSILIGGLVMSIFMPYGLAPSAKIITYWFGGLVLALFAWIVSKKYLGLLHR